jgi:TatD DNase family protein
MRNIMPVIFHGFNNSESIAKQIINAGYYLSFGHSLFNPSTETTFSSIDNNLLFLETDDSEISIEKIYRQASCIKNISVDALSLQVKKNTKKAFNINL